MKIARALIENYRNIERLELDCTDSLGRVSDLVLLVGPNTCGKTTVQNRLGMTLALPGQIEGTTPRPKRQAPPRVVPIVRSAVAAGDLH